MLYRDTIGMTLEMEPLEMGMEKLAVSTEPSLYISTMSGGNQLPIDALGLDWV